jgi:hypothetical protein
MKRFVLIGAVVAAALLLFVGLVSIRLRAGRPESLVAALRRADGEKRDTLLMRLSIAPGDVVGALAGGIDNTASDPAFRALLLEQLFKRHLRGPDPRCEPVFLAALQDPQVELRRAAARCMTAYSEAVFQTNLVRAVSDPDPEVRRHALSVFAIPQKWPMDLSQTPFGQLSEAAREKLRRECMEQRETETDPQLSFLLDATIGRDIYARCKAAIRARLASRIEEARKGFEDALALDPENRLAQMYLLRHHLHVGNDKKAVDLAREYGSLIEVPRLSRAPTIDGDPTDEVWNEAWTTDEFYVDSNWTVVPAEEKSKAYLAHRGGRLFVAMLGFADDLSKLVATLTERDSRVYRDDCVELTFCHDPGSGEHSRFIINPCGALFDVLGHNASHDFACEHRAGVFPDRGYWSVEFAVDATELQGKPLTPDHIWAVCFTMSRVGIGSGRSMIWPVFDGSKGRYPLAVFKDVQERSGRPPSNSRAGPSLDVRR